MRTKRGYAGRGRLRASAGALISRPQTPNNNSTHLHAFFAYWSSMGQLLDYKI